MSALLFWIIVGVMLLFGAMVVLQRNPVASALSLVVCFLGLAALYVSLDAYFIGVIQILVYAGAVMVLFVFVIMLLNAGTEKSVGKSWFAQIAGLPLLLAFVAVMGFVIRGFLPQFRDVEFGSWAGGTAREIGRALFGGDYILPFEVMTVLVLIAILGAVVLARKELD